MPDAINTPCQIRVMARDQCLEICLIGDWLVDAKSPSLTAVLNTLKQTSAAVLVFDTQALGRWDSLLITDLICLINAAKQHGLAPDLSSLPPAIQGLLKLVYAVPERNDARIEAAKPHWTVGLQQQLEQSWQAVTDMVEFIGLMMLTSVEVLRGQSHFRRLDFWLHTQECGPSALPIVTLISLLVGLILAFVGAVQLSLFGAQIYIANLVSLGMTREMGGLMTAIIMSGRTGAAYAAQLGTMRVNDEIDALKTMNLDPMAFLVLPRMLALIFIMPLLCLYADLMGIIGGALVTINIFDVSLTEYLDRTAHAVQMKDFVIGFIKCAVFGVLIALSGCMRGMQCGRSASAVGDAATSAVVTSIVLIVISDSVMTIICNRLGI